MFRSFFDHLQAIVQKIKAHAVQFYVVWDPILLTIVLKCVNKILKIAQYWVVLVV